LSLLLTFVTFEVSSFPIKSKTPLIRKKTQKRHYFKSSAYPFTLRSHRMDSAFTAFKNLAIIRNSLFSFNPVSQQVFWDKATRWSEENIAQCTS